MFHTIAFSESQDAAGAQVYMAGVPDPSLRVDGDDIVVPQDVNMLFGALACIGSTGSRANLISPSLRRLNPYEIQPVVLALFAEGINDLYLHEMQPIQLDYNESLNAQVTADPASAEQESIVAWLCDGPLQPTKGNVFKARFSTTGALVAGVWTNLTIDFVDEIPSGTYKCGGAYLVAATAVAARFYPVGGKWRPGFPVAQTLANLGDPKFRNFKLGDWFSFDQTQPPTIDILSSAAAGSTTYYGVMDLIRT